MNKFRKDDKWWFQMVSKTVWLLLGASISMTLYVVSLARTTEAESNKYTDMRISETVSIFMTSNADLKDRLDRIEDKLDRAIERGM